MFTECEAKRVCGVFLSLFTLLSGALCAPGGSAGRWAVDSRAGPLPHSLSVGSIKVQSESSA